MSPDANSAHDWLRARAGAAPSYVVAPHTLGAALGWTTPRALAALLEVSAAFPGEMLIHLMWECPNCGDMDDVTNALAPGQPTPLLIKCRVCAHRAEVTAADTDLDFEFLGGAKGVGRGGATAPPRRIAGRSPYSDLTPADRAAVEVMRARQGPVTAILADNGATVQVHHHHYTTEGHMAKPPDSKLTVKADGKNSRVEDVEHHGGETEVEASDGGSIKKVRSGNAPPDKPEPWFRWWMAAVIVPILVALIGLAGGWLKAP